MSVELKARTFKFDAGYGQIAVADNEIDGPPVLFIHGNSTCKEVFHNQFGSALAKSYRLIALDLPGCGASDDAAVAEDVYRMEPMARIVRTLLETLGAADAVLVGWSLGGHLAIELAGTNAGHKGLVISGTPPFGPAGGEVLLAFNLTEAMALTGQVNFTAEEAESYGRTILGESHAQEEGLAAAIVRADGRMRETANGDWSLNENAGLNQKSVVAGLKIPVAVIDGVDEPLVSKTWMSDISWGNLWRGKYHVIEHAAHAPFLQNPDAYNTLLTEYFDDIF